MGLQVQFYLQSGLTPIAFVVYILIFIYQRNYIRKLRTHMDDIDKAFDTNKQMVNIDDIKSIPIFEFKTPLPKSLRNIPKCLA